MKETLRQDRPNIRCGLTAPRTVETRSGCVESTQNTTMGASFSELDCQLIDSHRVVVTLSVIIPTYNRRHLLTRTFPTVLNQTLSATEYEVIVVIDGSHDTTRDYLRQIESSCQLQVIELETNGGPGRAKNAGLAAARGEIVLFLDDDLLCDTNLFAIHLAAHEPDVERLAVGSVMISSSSPCTTMVDLARKAAEYREAQRSAITDGGWPVELAIGTNVSMPLAALKRIGGFDYRLSRMHEDGDLALRLRAQGLRLKCLDRANASQIYEKSADEYVLSDCRRHGSNSILLARKHAEMRPHVPPARLYVGTISKKFFRYLALRSPLSPEPLLRVAFRGFERFGHGATSRRAAAAILAARTGSATFRAAAEELGSWDAMRSQFAMRIPILLYHHVGPAPSTSHYRGLSVTPFKFARQIAWLHRTGYKGIRLSDWYAWIMGTRVLPDRPVIIAFDDGYLDIAEHALPILQSYRYPAAIFLVTSLIGKCSEWENANGFAPLPLMTRDQILYWYQRGFEFGSHSRSHPDLTHLADQMLVEEIAGSSADLAALLGARPSFFAFPYGLFDERVCDVARRVYELSFTTEGGLNALSTPSDRLKRVEIRESVNLPGLFWRVRFGRAVPKLSHLLTDPVGVWKRHLAPLLSGCSQQ